MAEAVVTQVGYLFSSQGIRLSQMMDLSLSRDLKNCTLTGFCAYLQETADDRNSQLFLICDSA